MTLIDQIAEALLLLDDDMTAYLQPKTHTITYLTELSSSAEAEQLATDTNDLKLPTERDIDTYGIMTDFVDQLTDATTRNQLARALHSRGAYRRFREQIRTLGVENDWNHYRAGAYQAIARDWRREHHLPLR